ncbi:MAG TPA: glucose-6-phosphate isomerase [Caulifigura sp.]|jgi:glucose-6-phosphate isomerase|nr:glucose-6-phosphate isomerase [Caulifigura sp.]
MSAALTYDPSAALRFLKPGAREALSPKLEAARKEVVDDIALLASKAKLPAEKDPLDAGFIDWPARLLAGEENGLLRKIEDSAKRFRESVDRMVVLGIGGSYMGLRALFEAVCHPYHNQLTREERGNVPTLHFEGDNLDNDAAAGLLDLLKKHCKDPGKLAERWGIVVISKSGGTLETAAAFRIFREALEAYYGTGSENAKMLVIPVTGEAGKLRSISNAAGYPDTFPIPDGIGGRFSVLTAVGLYPAAVLGIDIRALLQGAAAITTTFKTAPLGQNPVLDYTGICHLLERDSGMDVRILSTWGKKLEACGLWYDQLLAESLGKHERGALPLTVVNTRDLHSRGQQHQEGKRDKLITNVIVDKASLPPVKVPQVAADRDQDQLNRLNGKGLPDLLAAAIAGTNKAYADDNRPTADIHLPKLDAYAVGQFLQMMMLATAVEGRLIGINPYGQPGVEAYKKNMGEILYGK